MATGKRGAPAGHQPQQVGSGSSHQFLGKHFDEWVEREHEHDHQHRDPAAPSQQRPQHQPESGGTDDPTRPQEGQPHHRGVEPALPVGDCRLLNHGVDAQQRCLVDDGDERQPNERR